ncbi:uncharacterized protein [Paramisgurnus dabryanus]|uniref:uncharacterized protein isoform X2 n=1 Tax=Paramisgurnus dabryanus TaxID=90735 RepID=UPI0031F470F1
MSKNPLNFLRKEKNLFDTNVEFKEMGHVDMMFDSAAIPESGTAKVRSRPTVKHFISNEALHGFAVPTPKVPLFSSFAGPSVNGIGSTTNLQNGGMISVTDMFEGEMLIPAPPSVAPPPPPPSSAAPPPPSFIPPPPQTYAERNKHINGANLHPPPMPPHKPPSLNGYEYSDDVDLASLRPPPMAPPKPPSDTSSFRGSLYSLDDQEIPDCPKFTPPPPPSMVKPPPVLPKTQKMPPLKPVRMSSIPSMESYTATLPAAAISTPSSFKPQNTAKLYSVEKSTLLIGQTERETPVQSILLLDDSTGNPAGVHVNGNSGGSFHPVQSVVPPIKPARRNSSAALLHNDTPDGFQVEAPVMRNPEPVPVSIAKNTPSEAPTPMNISPNIESRDVSQVKTRVDLPGGPHRYSPVLNRNLRTRGVENSGNKEKSTSPLALLMAAKERDKRNNLSRQNSTSSEASNHSVIQPSMEKPNSFTITPRDPFERPHVELNNQPVVPLSTKVDVLDGPYQKSVPSSTPPNSSVVVRGGVPVRDVESGEDVLFIPPPPEFANSDSEDDSPASPPTHPAPPPPAQSAPSRPAQAAPPPPAQAAPPPPAQAAPPPPAQAAPPPVKPSLPSPKANGPLTAPKPKPPSNPPKPPGPPPSIQPKLPVQTKPFTPPVKTTPSAPAGQTTLFSILQKKMLEMDPKFSAVKESESKDDWNSPFSDDEETSPISTIKKPFQTSSAAPPVRSQGVDMKELEDKAAKKAQDLTSKPQNSKQTFGMTFIVRPGTKQPITPVIKDGST